MRNNPKIYFNREIVNYSLENRKIELLTIAARGADQLLEREKLIPGLFPDIKLAPGSDATKTTHPSRAHVFKNKKYIFITTRVHPAETPGSFIQQGFLKVLMDFNNPRSIAFFENFVLVLVPILNPDGVVRGHYRCDTKARDLNRFYQPQDMSDLPGPNTVIQVSKYLSADGRLFAYIDKHAHSNFDSAFLISCCNNNPEVEFAQRKFARLHDIYSKTLDYHGCQLTRLPEKLTDKELCRAKTRVFHETKCPLAYTIEVNYCKGNKEKDRYAPEKQPAYKLDGKTKKEGYRLHVSDYEEAGATLVDAMLEYIGKHPHSILGNTCFKDINGLNSFVTEEMKVAPVSVDEGEADEK
jgi:hypothetical protein